MSAAGDDLIERAFAEIRQAPEGVHDLAGPARAVDTALPVALRDFYRVADGAELYFGAIVVAPAARAHIREGRAYLGEIDGDELAIDLSTGAVWRRDRDSGELIEEATSFDRFLLGALEAEAVLYDAEGEFVGGIDEGGELESATVIARERRRVKRDREAPAPRWRLARALTRAGRLDAARDELEAVVAARPGFAWAWYDLARLAERLGDLEAARDDMQAAADAGHELAGFFHAHVARLASARGDAEAARAAAARALAADPHIARAQREGAEASLAGGELGAAAELHALAAALAPRDLAVVDLGRRIAAARAATPLG